MAETNTTVTETNKAENGSTGAYGGDPTQAVKGGANLPEKAVSTSEPEQTAKTFTQAEALRKNLCKNNQPQKNDFVVRAADRSLSFLFQYKLNTAVCQAPDAKYPDFTALRSVASGYFAAASVQPVRIHYLKLTEHFAPVFCGIVHFGAISAVARYRAFKSAVSLGNTLLCLFRRR